MKTHLVFAVMTVVLLAFVISQSRQKPFTFEDYVVSQARALSLEKYRPPKRVPSALRKLNYDQVRDIRFKDDHTLWRQQGLPFQARFFFAAGGGDEHSPLPVTIYQINKEGAGPVRFSPDQFTFGPLAQIPEADKKTGGYAGFRIHYPLKKPNQLDELLVFQGASYFRPLAGSMTYGISARGVTIDTLGREDFPAFTTFWLVEPAPGAREMTLYALLDGRDLAGAYEFRVVPGAETVIHVRAVLYPRNRIKDVGLAPLTSMYWYGENTSNTFGNWRPEVHDSDGLQVLRSNGEWIWRPLAWAKDDQFNILADKNPRGFGLFQRDRDFAHYQDLEAKYNERPSAWVQPVGDWGAGSVVLRQNHTDNEFRDNIVAYWRPDRGLQKGERFEFAYTLTTFSEKPDLPSIGRCVWTRLDYQEKPNYRKILVDFTGGELNNLPPDANITPEVWVDEKGVVSDFDGRAHQIPNTKIWRASFGVTNKAPGKPLEMRCLLSRDGKPLTETWTYTWVK